MAKEGKQKLCESRTVYVISNLQVGLGKYIAKLDEKYKLYYF